MSETTHLNVGIHWWKKADAFAFMKLIWVGEDNNAVKSVNYTISYKIIGTMATQKLDQGNGNQENQGKRYFL